MKRTLSFFLVFLLALSFFACGKETEPAEKLGGIRTEEGDVYPEEFLSFDKQEVSFDEFRYFYLNYRDMYLAEDPSFFETENGEETLKQTVLECLLDNWAVRFLAKENKVSLNREETKAIDDYLEESIAVFGSKDAFLEDLHTSYTSWNYCKNMLEWSALNDKLFRELFEEGGKEAYTDEEFYAFYQDRYIAVQQIYLPFAEGETKDACTGTLALADSIRKEAEAGSDFWALIQKYGKDENMLDYPDGYYFTKGEAEDALYEASKALNIGEISQPVIGEAGIYLIRRMEYKTLRMDENRQTALFGYYDTLNEWHAGEYDRVFQELYRSRAEEIQVEYSKYWDLVSTKTVY